MGENERSQRFAERNVKDLFGQLMEREFVVCYKQTLLYFYYLIRIIPAPLCYPILVLNYIGVFNKISNQNKPLTISNLIGHRNGTKLILTYRC